MVHFKCESSGLETGFGAGFQLFDVAAQCRGRRDAEDEVQPPLPAEVDHFGTAIMAVGPDQDHGVWPVGADLGAFGALGRPLAEAVTNRPSPSNTTRSERLSLTINDGVDAPYRP